MVAIKNIGFSFVLVLIIVSQIFALSADGGSDNDTMTLETTDTIPVSVFQNSVSNYLFAIEVNNSVHNISEVHRLSSMFIHPNQVIPLNFDFRSYADFPIPTIYSSLVPIFIRGHALLN